MVDGDQNVFIGNSFSANAPELTIATSTGTQFISNSIPSAVTVALSGSTSVASTTFFKSQPLVKLALADAFSSATFQDDDGAIFSFDQHNAATVVNTQGSSLTLTSAQIGTGSTVITRTDEGWLRA